MGKKTQGLGKPGEGAIILSKADKNWNWPRISGIKSLTVIDIVM